MRALREGLGNAINLRMLTFYRMGEAILDAAGLEAQHPPGVAERVLERVSDLLA